MRDVAVAVAVAIGMLVAATSWSAALAEGAAVETGEPAPDGRRVDDVAVPTEPVDLGEVGRSLTVTAGPGAAIELADGRRFLDTVELTLAGDGQRLVNELGFDDYTAGVAEMPARWPTAALRAQAVAARTYAWHQMELGTFAARGYDICDTVACQVFRGAAQQEGDTGERWRAAVDGTAGEVLVSDGEPILARYFSTSGGRTLPNEVVFPSSGSRPYLVGVDDPADAISPYHRWEVRFTRDEFDALTGVGETLSQVTPVARVERLGPVDIPDTDLRFVGEDGTEVTLGSVATRSFLSEVAPDRFPDRFPSARDDGLGRLPATIPSSRFEVVVGADEVVVTGRGWGHGVGMGQYGAYGRALDGAAYDDILAAYYGGLAPTREDDLPERIRVGLSSTAVGSIRGDVPLTLRAGGEVLTEAGAGTFALARRGDAIAVTAPPGWGQPAIVSRTVPAANFPSSVRAVAVEAVSATPGEARLRVTTAGGDEVLDRTLGPVEAGTVTTRWDLRDDERDPVPAGRYAVEVGVVAADGSRDGAALPVTVTDPPPAATRRADAGRAPLALGAGLLVVAASGLVVATRRRRSVDARTSAEHPRSEPARQERP